MTQSTFPKPSNRRTTISTLTISMPDSITQQARELAQRGGLTVDQWIASATAEKISALLSPTFWRTRPPSPHDRTLTA